jgi:hypothetical protein
MDLANLNSAISSDDLFEAVVIVSFMVLVVGLGVLLLWMRDRFRDMRGVPDWVRERGKLKASRVAACYGILWFGIGTIGLIMGSVRAEHAWQTIMLLASAAIFVLLAHRSSVAVRILGQQINALNREHGEDHRRPHEPLG